MKISGNNGKLVFILAVAVSLLVFAGCGKENSVETADQGSHAPASAEYEKEAFQEKMELGNGYLADSDYEKAIDAFSEAIEIDPKNAVAYMIRAQALLASGETEEHIKASLQDYQLMLEIGDEAMKADAYLGIADIFIRQRDFTGASKTLQLGLEDTGDNRIAIKLEQVLHGDIIDAAGKTLRARTYDSDGVLIRYADYVYDTLGRKIGWSYYRISGGDENAAAFNKRAVCAYDDETGHEISREFFDANGNLLTYDEILYNEKNEKTERIRYYADGAEQMRYVYFYDEDSVLIRYDEVWGGELRSYYIMEYFEGGHRELEYNKDNELIATIEYGSDSSN